MNTTFKKLHKLGIEKMKPFIKQLVLEGLDKNIIVQACKQYTTSKVNDYYYNIKRPVLLGDSLMKCFDEMAGNQQDSKAEAVFYNMLLDEGIDFKFQYKIGRYRADYLLGDDLIVELDGPQHDKGRDEIRDKYLRKLGYRILRVPIHTVAIDREAVFREIELALYNTPEVIEKRIAQLEASMQAEVIRQ